MSRNLNGISRPVRALKRSAVCLAMVGFAPMPASPQSEAPQITFGFSRCSPQVNVLPGETFERTLDCTILTEKNPDPVAGVQGWSLSFTADNLDLVSATTLGTLAAKITDDPPGLFKNGFEKTEVARGHGSGDCADREGIISAVVLSFLEVVTLPPQGTATVCRFTVSGQSPAAENERKRARVFYVNGCGGSG